MAENTTRKQYTVNLKCPSSTMIARLLNTPELRNVNNGLVVTDLRVIVSRSWFDQGKNGWQTKEQVFKFSAWRAAAERMIQRGLKAGDILMIEYHPSDLTATSWTGDDGQLRHSLEGTPINVHILAQGDAATAMEGETPQNGHVEEETINFG